MLLSALNRSRQPPQKPFPNASADCVAGMQVNQEHQVLASLDTRLNGAVTKIVNTLR